MLVSSIIIIIAIAVAIPLLLMKNGNTDSAAGTIGKVDKYSNDKLSEKDIQIRSKLLGDTVKLRKMISDLLTFNIFAFEFKSRIDTKWLPGLETYYSQAGVHCSCIDELKDFSLFIGNHIDPIRIFTDNLIEIHKGGKIDKTIDFEAKISNFINFVSQLMHRDSIVEETIAEIDNSIKTDKAKKFQLAKLKEIRDILVMDDLIYALYIGDKHKLQFSLNQSVSNITGTINSYVQSSIYSGIKSNQIHSSSDLNNFQISQISGNFQGTNQLMGSPINLNAVSYIGSNFDLSSSGGFSKDGISAMLKGSHNLGVVLEGNSGGGLCNMPLNQILAGSTILNAPLNNILQGNGQLNSILQAVNPQ
ncbi:MAG: hypothetical protein QG635_332 [Bacteroidota bacterium]|nr:hypothetical protein [Bacteroidota bacterium]